MDSRTDEARTGDICDRARRTHAHRVGIRSLEWTYMDARDYRWSYGIHPLYLTDHRSHPSTRGMTRILLGDVTRDTSILHSDATGRK